MLRTIRNKYYRITNPYSKKQVITNPLRRRVNSYQSTDILHKDENMEKMCNVCKLCNSVISYQLSAPQSGVAD